MKTISSALSTALGAPVQRPAVLVRAGFATVRYWSSWAALTWQAQNWLRTPLRVDGLSADALQLAGTLALDNTDGAAGALVLAEDPTDIAFSIWGYDAAAVGAVDIVHLCDAVGAGCSVGEREVRISLRARAEMLAAPRTRVMPASGFATLLPAGATLTINGISYTLERSR